MIVCNMELAMFIIKTCRRRVASCMSLLFIGGRYPHLEAPHEVHSRHPS